MPEIDERVRHNRITIASKSFSSMWWRVGRAFGEAFSKFNGTFSFKLSFSGGEAFRPIALSFYHQRKLLSRNDRNCCRKTSTDKRNEFTNWKCMWRFRREIISPIITNEGRRNVKTIMKEKFVFVDCKNFFLLLRLGFTYARPKRAEKVVGKVKMFINKALRRRRKKLWAIRKWFRNASLFLISSTGWGKSMEWWQMWCDDEWVFVGWLEFWNSNDV